jgi:hypothetical protein
MPLRPAASTLVSAPPTLARPLRAAGLGCSSGCRRPQEKRDYAHPSERPSDDHLRNLKNLEITADAMQIVRTLPRVAAMEMQ